MAYFRISFAFKKNFNFFYKTDGNFEKFEAIEPRYKNKKNIDAMTFLLENLGQQIFATIQYSSVFEGMNKIVERGLFSRIRMKTIVNSTT